MPEWKLYKRIILRHFKRKFDGIKYEDQGILSNFRIMRRVWQYYHDPKHFMTIKSHKEYLNKYSKNVFVIKNDSDYKKLLEEIK